LTERAAPGVPAEPTAEVIALEPVPLSDPDDNGTVVESVAADAVTGEQGRLALGGLAWSDWVPLNVAVQDATTSPGVYAARTEGQLVYIGMAGERRGQGVRGRLTVCWI